MFCTWPLKLVACISKETQQSVIWSLNSCINRYFMEVYKVVALYYEVQVLELVAVPNSCAPRSSACNDGKRLINEYPNSIHSRNDNSS